ncbi:PilZ domain-containing protein [Breznakiella homolactica]|uniref:PilZ domain-containing protein n=1 Tax=Breznakiella homolactica TaxID=2798577 RepID=A0A7T7XLA6_9SPIR|nr:PilZ domain-containing protein [Breznakiella homolactica]QQO08302.1 PilZ domain-containing protein [Breznakiella homolactica]
MKLLLIFGSDETYNLIAMYVKPLGFELIRYRHVLKAMDNIEEIDPTGIIISAEDFPRHWKTLVQFVRTDRPKETTPIIILRGENFPLDETSKAFYLGVSGIVSDDLSNAMEIDRLQSILSRYIPVEEKRKARRFRPEEWSRLDFLFTNPGNRKIITGSVQSISSTGLSFRPDQPALTAGLALNTELEECSLRAGDSILSPVCRVIRTGRNISMEFISFPGQENDVLEAYLEQLPLAEYRNSQKRREEVPATG